MATLQTQYKNYLRNNPDSKLTYEEWLEEFSKKLAEVVQDSELSDWDATLMDGLSEELTYEPVEEARLGMVDRLRAHLSSLTQEEFDKEWEEITKMGFGGPSILEVVDSPYCPICSGCGEEGCCSPLMCKQDPKGDCCQAYLSDLKFGYRMYKDLIKLIGEDEKYKQQIDEMLDKNYNIIYKNERN